MLRYDSKGAGGKNGHCKVPDGLQAELGETEEDITVEERLLAGMDQGLYSLQQCALVVGHLWFAGDVGIRKRVLQLLHQKVRLSPPPIRHRRQRQFLRLCMCQGR